MADALSVYNRMCVSKGIVVCAPEPIHTHTCDQTCRMWRHGTSDEFVCVASRHVHVCGDACEKRTISEEAVVCRLTGLVLDNIEYGIPYSAGAISAPQRRVSTTTTSAAVAPDAHIANVVFNTCKRIFKSKNRTRFDATHRARIHAEKLSTITQILKRAPELQTNIRAVLSIYYREMQSVLASSQPVTLQQLRVLAGQISEYWTRMFPKRHHHKELVAFTAECIWKLSQGFCIDGTVLIPKVRARKIF